jgi:hypothetical protein
MIQKTQNVISLTHYISHRTHKFLPKILDIAVVEKVGLLSFSTGIRGSGFMLRLSRGMGSAYLQGRKWITI